MKWSERFVEWLLDLTAKSQRDPYALWPAFLGFVLALLLMIFPGVLKLRLTHSGKGTHWSYPELGDVFNIIWIGSAAVGLILFCKGVIATCARLEKAGKDLY
ncbi:hypothetical protein [Aeromonas salmonicida]|uniref:hypothetical protein n=1 Tax=Aeromonas salmonicida TaxID=645 RepID=UPI0031FDCF73